MEGLNAILTSDPICRVDRASIWIFRTRLDVTITCHSISIQGFKYVIVSPPETAKRVRSPQVRYALTHVGNEYTLEVWQ